MRHAGAAGCQPLGVVVGASRMGGPGMARREDRVRHRHFRAQEAEVVQIFDWRLAPPADDFLIVQQVLGGVNLEQEAQ